MLHSACSGIALLLLTCPTMAAAQGPSLVPIEPLLTSHEPRLIALGAWEVIKREDDSQTLRLIEMAEHWDPAQRHRRENGDRYDAMTVTLDALIQRNAVISPAAVIAVAHAFPDQALILASRMHTDAAEPILLSWFEAGRGIEHATLDRNGENRLLLARVSAMMLAKDHPDEVAACLLADSVEELAVSVPDPDGIGGERCLVDCEAPPICQPESADEGQTGWPPVFAYTLEENNPDGEASGGFLIEAGGDRITFRRVRAEVHQNYCFSPHPLTATTRHHLLAEMLHGSDKDIPWGPQMNFTLPWGSDAQFLRDLSRQVAGDEDQLRATARLFYAKGLVTKSQIETSRPRLAVVLFDDRRPAQPAHAALPAFDAHDPRTTCRISRWQ
jgi:hypothetical protein